MDDRSQTGAEAFPPLAAGDRTIGMSSGVEEPANLVGAWLNEQPDPEMLRERGNIFGLSSLPYRNADVLQQPGGRDWRRIHNDQVRYGGGWRIFGMALALALFLFARGRVPIAALVATALLVAAAIFVLDATQISETAATSTQATHVM